jgi:MFS family permease
MTLARLFGSTFCELIGVLMLMPVLTVQLAAQGQPAWLIGLFGAALYLAIFLVTPFTARITRRCGLRQIYIATGFAPLLVVGVFVATDAPGAWLLAVAVLGASGGLRWVSAESYVVSAAPAARRGAVIGAFQTMVGACFVLGPAMLTVTGTSGHLAFQVSAALLTAGLLCLWGLPALPATDDAPVPGAFTRLWRERPLLVLAALLGGFLESGPATFLPVEALGGGLSGRAAAGLVAVLGIGGFVIQFPLGVLADRLKPPALLRVLLWAALGGALLLLSAEDWPPTLWLSAFLWGAAGGGIYTLAMVTVGHAYTGVGLVGATSSLVFAFSAGAALSPALAGAVMQVRPDGGFALLMAGVIGAGLWALRDGKRTSPDRS